MTIVCGTDFSTGSERALRVAARFAAHFRTPLHLIHAAQHARNLDFGASRDATISQLLDRAAERAEALGARVGTHIEDGPPDEALIRVAQRDDAELIVVGALGTRMPDVWQLGSHVERLAQRSHVPVLVVRDDGPLTSWLADNHPLRIALGADFSRSSDTAARLVDEWRAIGPCKVTAIHLYWPPQEFARLGLSGVRSYLDPDPDVTRTLVRDLKHRLAPKDDPESLEIVVEPHLGRLGDRLADLAAHRESDVLVVGSKPRTGFDHLLEAPVSHWALHAARSSVLCVPLPTREADSHVPRVHDVLVATDFSPAGNAAIGMAYALTPAGGTVHIVHVVSQPHPDPITLHDVFALEWSGKSDARRDSTHAALAEHVPSNAYGRNTRFYALESNDAAAAICQAAARLEIDLICLGRRGRSSLAAALLGSVSQHVVATAECPVLLTHGPRS